MFVFFFISCIFKIINYFFNYFHFFYFCFVEKGTANFLHLHFVELFRKENAALFPTPKNTALPTQRKKLSQLRHSLKLLGVTLFSFAKYFCYPSRSIDHKSSKKLPRLLQHNINFSHHIFF